jgi:quinol monooxygenase YgiN
MSPWWRRDLYQENIPMENELYSIYHLTLEAGKFPAFKALIEKIVEATSHEADTLTYEYVVNAEQTAVHIIERYRMVGVLPHVEQTFSPYAEEFLNLSTIEKLFVYGNPTPEVKAKLDSFGAIYLAPFAGFTR